MEITGDKVQVAKSQADLYTFLTDVKNYEQLMPPEVKKFEADADSFIFGLGGMPEVKLRLNETTPNSKIVLKEGGGKIPFNLHIEIEEGTDEQCNCQLTFTGDFNPMVRMMIERPLKKFISQLTEALTKL